MIQRFERVEQGIAPRIVIDIEIALVKEGVLPPHQVHRIDHAHRIGHVVGNAMCRVQGKNLHLVAAAAMKAHLMNQTLPDGVGGNEVEID